MIREAIPLGVRLLVDRQAEDPALWIPAKTCQEAFLQEALRRLHAAIEQEDIDALYAAQPLGVN